MNTIKFSDMISVDEMLPNDGEYVLVYAGNYAQSQKWEVARFEKGISLQDRDKMERGELDFKMVSGIHFDGNVSKPIYTTSERWKVYKSADESGNNKKPYCWSSAPKRYFGQEVTHWMNLPKK